MSDVRHSVARLVDRLPRRHVRVRGGRSGLVAEVADTPLKRWLGLSTRRSLGPEEGMIFVFDEPGRHSFWMQGTSVPLSIAFLRDDGTIVSVHDLVPFSETPVVSEEPVRYALEAPRGWFTGARVAFD